MQRTSHAAYLGLLMDGRQRGISAQDPDKEPKNQQAPGFSAVAAPTRAAMGKVHLCWGSKPWTLACQEEDGCRQDVGDEH